MTDVRRCVICSSELAPTEIQTDVRCLANTRRNLARIDLLYAYLPALLGQPDGAALGAVMGGRSDEASLPGGDALAMLGPGAGQGEGRADDPPAVAWELADTCEEWATIRNEPGPTNLTVPASITWLTKRCGWAADYHDGFVGNVDTITRILHRLETVTATSDAPEHGAPCYCGADLLRHWTNTGLSDDWLCPRCGKTYTEPAYWLAVRAQLETHQAEPTG